jgi:two-component system C4-dicarboxylate transport sensor histidine kinase DctB
VIRVSDNGPGIQDSDIERIFDPFFTTKAPGLGTGLGLSICARLVEDMGGRIDGANREGGGAAFTVRVPAVSGSLLVSEEGPAYELRGGAK